MRLTHNLNKYKPLRKKLRNKATEEEAILWAQIRNNQLGAKFRRQASFGTYIVDFYCPSHKLVIELDGSQHLEANLEYDNKRTEYLNTLGLKILRIWNNDIRYNLSGVVEEIKHVWASCPTTPSSPATAGSATPPQEGGERN
ncbi:endonuclease domain-containing protein [Candidatus Kuenenbacteria bacterium]|nr:endonuclease domain-containing protein [Candidatus Kuenenbacteria bacterium]